MISRYLILLVVLTGANLAFFVRFGPSAGENPFCQSAWEFPLDTSLQILYIANAGVLIQQGEQKILIDAIHRPYSEYYLATPDSILEKIMKAQPPFDGIDLLVVSHVHGDHFSGADVAAYLQQNPQVQAVGPPQMKDSLAAISPDFSAIADQVKTFSYQAGSWHHLEVAGIKIALHDLVHGSERNYWVENLASIIELGEHRILHVGDPDLREVPFTDAAFQESDISVALLPDWLLTSAAAKKLVDQYIAPEEIIAVHISPKWEKDSRAKMQQFFPKATLFTQPMEIRRFGGH